MSFTSMTEMCILLFLPIVSGFLFGGSCNCPSAPQCQCSTYVQPQLHYQPQPNPPPLIQQPPALPVVSSPQTQDTSYGGGYVAAPPPLPFKRQSDVTQGQDNAEATSIQESLKSYSENNVAPYEESLKKQVEVDVSSDPKNKDEYKVFAVKTAEDRCRSEQLRNIIQKNIVPESLSLSKKQISLVAKKEFGYNFDVICSNSKFSYLVSSALYCEYKSLGVICLVFQH